MTQHRIFLAHASEDRAKVKDLYNQLKATGLLPWLDTVDLVPGKEWQIQIVKAIKEATICLVCFSKNSVSKRGFVQKELRYAMSTLAELPPDRIYLIPVRLDECELPDRRIEETGSHLRDIHWVDLFEPDGFKKLLQAIIKEIPPITSSNYFQVGDVVADGIEFITNHVFPFSRCKFDYNSEPRASDKLHPYIDECRTSALKNAHNKSKEKGSPFFDGPTVRFNRVELSNENPITEEVNLSIFLSDCQWNDWVVQYYCLMNAETSIKCKISPGQIRKQCVDEKSSFDKRRNMEAVQTCNQLGTSIVIISSDGFVGIQKRSGGMDNQERWGPSASENISRYFDEQVQPKMSRFMNIHKDFTPSQQKEWRSLIFQAGEEYTPKSPPNGFFCAIRGIYEEVGDFISSISLSDIRLTAIVFDRELCVPHLYFLVEPKLTMDQMHKVRQSQAHVDSWETSEIYWFRWNDRDEVTKVFSGQWASVSKAAVMRAIQLKLKENGRTDLEISEFFSSNP